MGFRLREHTADVAIEGEGETLGECFAALADGTAAAQCDDVPEEGGERFSLSVDAEDLEAACFDYLDDLLYRRDVRNVLPVDNDAAVERRGDRWTVAASARGVPLERLEAREVKAVTYSDMAIEETDDGWRAYVVLDV